MGKMCRRERTWLTQLMHLIVFLFLLFFKGHRYEEGELVCICEHVCMLEFHFHLFFLCVTEHGIACFHIYLCEQVCVHTGRNIYVDIDISVLLKLYY